MSPDDHEQVVERPRVELFVRTLTPDTARGQQDRVIERLQRLEEESRLCSADVYVCGECVCPSTAAAATDPGRFLLDRFERFEEWAADRDRDLVGFRRRCVESTFADDPVTGITFPRMVLAEFVGDRLRFVAPSGASETTTVADRVDYLAGVGAGDG